jgi:c-di-GMP-binding flagellar brake protein YcgR
MVSDKIKLNTIIEIEEDDKKYQCRVLDESEDTISIDIPVSGHEYLFLSKDQKIDILYLVENECYYSGLCTVIKRYKNNINMYMLTRPINLKRIQRRNFVRAKTLESIKYKLNSEDAKWKDGIMLDLSGGGMKVYLKDDINIGEKIQLEIEENREKISVLGEVVRVEQTEKIYGVEFKNIDERKRDKLVKRVFTIMVKERKRV